MRHPGAIIQVRMGSQRLPGKVLAPIEGRPLLAQILRRLGHCQTLEWIGVATTDHPSDDPVVRFCNESSTPCYRGSVDDVLARFTGAMESWDLDPVVRITGDCPFVCPETVDSLVRALIRDDTDYAGYATPTVHEGIDPFSAGFLRRMQREVDDAKGREHLALLVERPDNRARCAQVPAPAGHEPRPGIRWSVDEPDQLEFAREAFAALDRPDRIFTTPELLAWVDRRGKTR